MTEVTLEEIHEDVEEIKRDVSELKRALLVEEGELSPWVKERIERYLQKGPKKLRPHEEIEKEFL